MKAIRAAVMWSVVTRGVMMKVLLIAAWVELLEVVLSAIRMAMPAQPRSQQ
eukprot:CAMPEP_0204148452 /NCGR_PEP_ID=MMETSP0361-20130328/23555_1 /ASSEMBLY_ACC=CAM_ASM_000343 /TAXON_ID=268821 /ORGANISM="Scrippsiella Hangoei, Strain SHTV-5" /LENGTH=50 /DNA_ID=CAMNT_0051102795 /DNA_START=524 /DNA_END=676 /DNA_ORIENTATION=+